MTNSERLTSHNALIDEAIAKAEALPDAGGGASVETCEVTFVNCSNLNWTGVLADGTVSHPAYAEGTYVVQKSYITIEDSRYGTYMATAFNITGGAVMLSGVADYSTGFIILTNAGDSVTIEFIG